MEVTRFRRWPSSSIPSAPINLSKSFNCHSMNATITQNCIKQKRRKINLQQKKISFGEGEEGRTDVVAVRGDPVEEGCRSAEQTTDRRRGRWPGLREWKAWAFRRQRCRSRSGDDQHLADEALPDGMPVTVGWFADYSAYAMARMVEARLPRVLAGAVV